MDDRRFPEDQSPFWHYQCSFDAIEVVKRHGRDSLDPVEGLVTNYMGVKFDPKIYPEVLTGSAGTVEPMPWPNNWHADLAEWAAALRAVDLSTDRFVAVELGCGWGCWINITGFAARSAGKPVTLIGVEADRGHVRFAHEALELNGFALHEAVIYHGVAGSAPGTALFPKRDANIVHWGLEPIFNASDEQIKTALASEAYEALNVVPLPEILDNYGPIDLLHVDIQGGEADLLEDCIGVLDRAVRYLVVGTHSRVIEGRIEKTMLGCGWKFEMDRPAISSLTNGVPRLKVDGVHGWRNPSFS